MSHLDSKHSQSVQVLLLHITIIHATNYYVRGFISMKQIWLSHVIPIPN